MQKKILFFLFLGLASCSTIEYRSNGTIPIFISPKIQNNTAKVVDGTLEFYLWGNIPDKHIIDTDKELAKVGLLSAANVTFYEYIRPKDLFWSILTLGIYTPKSFRIKAYGIHQ